MRNRWVGGILALALLILAVKSWILPRMLAVRAVGPGPAPMQAVTDLRGTRLLVANSQGGYVPGATVTFRREGRSEPVAEVTMDETGSRTFRLPDGESGWAGLLVEARMGWLSGSTVLQGHPGDYLRIKFPKTVPLRGLVVSKRTRESLGDVGVRTGWGTVQTDVEGRFQVGFAPPLQFLDGSVLLEVLLDGGRTQSFHFPCSAAGRDLVLEVE